MNREEPSHAQPQPTLRRFLTLGPLISYGLAVIVGAGIYVAIGAVIARAGEAAPLSFLFAGMAAALTGLCYADLASRFPEAAGAAAYVKHSFGSVRLAQATGAAMAIAVALGAASIARGAVQYLVILLPLSESALITILVGGFTAISILGVRESVGLAAVLGAIEIAGLMIAAAAGLLAAPDYEVSGMIPTTFAEWRGIMAGGFIAFFAFVGFESLANMAEEVKNPRRNVPLAIAGSIAASIVLYVAVTLAVVWADIRGEVPLLGLFDADSAIGFAVIAFLAVASGVLVEIVILSRLFYGMARIGELPAALGRVHPRTQTPIVATLLAGGIVLFAALLLPFEGLLLIANAFTLVVFAVVDLALWRIQRHGRPTDQSVFVVWSWVPPLAAAVSVTLIVAEILF